MQNKPPRSKAIAVGRFTPGKSITVRIELVKLGGPTLGHPKTYEFSSPGVEAAEVPYDFS